MAKLWTTSVRQIGVLVKDIDKSVEEFEKFLGVKCDWVGVTEDYTVTKQELYGQPCTGRLKQALFNLENIQIELVSPYGEGDSIWKKCLEENGEGLHHIAFKTNNIQEAVDSINTRCGSELMQYGQWPDSPKNGQYAYIDLRNSIKTIVEIMESPEGEPWDEMEEYK